MRDVRHVLRALTFAIAVVCATWRAPASACPRVATLRELAGKADRIALVRTVERRLPDPADESVSCLRRDRVTVEVLETWKGSPMARFEMDLPLLKDERTESAAMVVGLFPCGDGWPPLPQLIRDLEHLDRTDLPAIRAAVARAVALAEEGDTPGEARLHAHIVESLRHPATRMDGLLEAIRLDGESLSDAEALDLAGIVENENPSGQDLSVLDSLLGNRLTASLRTVALRRLDEAFASDEPEPVEWARSVLRLLGWADPAVRDAVGVVEETIGTAVEPAAQGTEGDRRWEDEWARYEAREREKWQQLRASWPALRRTLGG